MTIGVFGYAEHVITEPLSPKDIVKIIYDMCMPSDPIEAVLQQEVGVASGHVTVMCVISLSRSSYISQMCSPVIPHSFMAY